MAYIKPFRALRPTADYARQIASVPYDVVSTEEARGLAADNPLSFLHVIRPEIDVPEVQNIYDDSVYKKAEENFQHLLGKQYLVRENENCIYLYRLETETHSQIGIAACCSVDEYANGIIKKHEYTRKEKEDDRVRHMLSLQAHPGPVLLTFRSSEDLNSLIESSTAEEPLFDFTAADNIRHTLWKIEDPADSFVEAFRDIPNLYIADGHHRAAGAYRVREEMKQRNHAHTGEEEYNFFLCVMFPSDQLNIDAYNRYVSDLGVYSEQAFLDTIRQRCPVEETEQTEPQRKGEVRMYLNKKWYLIRMNELFTESRNNPVENLDLTVFESVVLTPLLQITDQRNDRRIDFVGGRGSDKKLSAMVDEHGGAAFTFYPISVDELLEVADADMIMPPKSTWFAPKLRSGLLVHTFEQ
jgi:uncharacterized protein (DUF1015 family)